MRLIRGLHNLKSELLTGAVVTIGNYDGVHLGHQKILSFVREKSRELNLPSVVVIFEPQPEEFFAKNRVLRLTSLREKVYWFEKYGVDLVVVLQFNRYVAALSAEKFIVDILVNLLKVKHLVVGDDFVFGNNKEGGYQLLKQAATAHQFQITQINSFKIEDVRVSSSFIRTAVLDGCLDRARKFLGYPYAVTGRVVHGKHLGRDLGFPTANIYLKNVGLPPSGVYMVKIRGLTEKPLFGAANIGFQSEALGRGKLLEVYILDFDSDIYGRLVTIEFQKKIRDERRFDSLAELQSQIKNDLVTIRTLL